MEGVSIMAKKNYAQMLCDLEKYYGDWFTRQETQNAVKMSSDLYPYQQLFSPITVNRLKIKNRIVMAPMGNIQMPKKPEGPTKK